MAVSTPFRRVVAYAPERVASFSLGIISEVFGYDRTAQGMPEFELSICTRQPGPVRTDTGLTILIEHGVDQLAEADLVVMLPWEDLAEAPHRELTEALHAAVARGAIVASCCTGSFMLAEAGLLDGARATTHWRWAGEFARRFPAATVLPDVLYVDEGQIVTGAGAAATIDMSLYLIRREYGAAIATGIARALVVPPHRDGGQAQFVAAPVPDGCDDDRLGDVLAWAREHLNQPLTVPQLATRALMSPRSFARRFRAATGTTPHAWLLGQRLHRAEELLEEAELSIEEVARRVGFGTAAALREQFVRRRGVAPRDYRRAFAAR